MRYRCAVVLAVLSTALLVAEPAPGQVVGCPDLDMSIVVQEIPRETALLVMPDGSGPPLTAAMGSDGILVDATIHLTLFSSCPPTGALAGYPAEDMWLEPTDGPLVFCAGGSIADGPTDDSGNTTWSGPLQGGGWDMGSCIIRLASGEAPSGWRLPLYYNSPDLNADLVVNLTDVSVFAGDFYSHQYAFRSDLYFDYVVNLSDLTVMTGTVGKTCP